MTVVHDIFDFDTALNEGSYTRKILIEGDSWVSHPLPGARHLGLQFDDFSHANYLILTLPRRVMKPTRFSSRMASK